MGEPAAERQFAVPGNTAVMGEPGQFSPKDK
jgi:hypothetical protein